MTTAVETFKNFYFLVFLGESSGRSEGLLAIWAGHDFILEGGDENSKAGICCSTAIDIGAVF